MAFIRLGKKRYKLPGSQPVRLTVGTLLIVAGMFGFLPVIGFWMIPLGVLVLSVDVPFVRRIRRRIEVWWGYRQERNGRQKNGQRRDSGGPAGSRTAGD